MAKNFAIFAFKLFLNAKIHKEVAKFAKKKIG